MTVWKGRVVVASRVGGTQDQIVDGFSGVLVDPSDLPGFGVAVARILDGGGDEEMGRRARKRVRSAYLPPHYLTAYFELMEELAEM